MSDQEKDNKEFEFIKEQVVEKKHKKLKKWLLPPLLTLIMAILFGLVASFTIIIAEPKLKELLVDDESRKPVYFPTENDLEDDLTAENPTGSITPTPSTTPVVVNQYIAGNINDYISMNDDIRKVAYDVNRSILNIKSKFKTEDIFGNTVVTTEHATGVFIFNNSKELLVLVSLDKVKGADDIKVIFDDTISVDATLQDYESELNLAVIAVPIEKIPKLKKDGLQEAKLGISYSLTVGTPVIALGSPNGHPGSLEIGFITSMGSSSSVTDNELDLFNTSIVDNKNSDGIVVDLKGQVVGVITQKLKEKGYEDLNTVIGISRLKQIIKAMGDKEPRLYCGVKTVDMTSDTKVQHKVPNGIYVKDVLADSPAFKAGIQNGDILLKVGDVNIASSNSFFDIINKYKSNDKIRIKVQRTVKGKDTSLTLVVTLSEKSK